MLKRALWEKEYHNKKRKNNKNIWDYSRKEISREIEKMKENKGGEKVGKRKDRKQNKKRVVFIAVIGIAIDQTFLGGGGRIYNASNGRRSLSRDIEIFRGRSNSKTRTK